MNDDDKHSVSQAHSSTGDQTDWTEDSDDDLYQSIISDNGEDYVSSVSLCVGWSFHVLLCQMDVEDSPPHDDARDLVQSIEGMYRVLDLISEQGSGGLGDPIVLVKLSLTDCS